jgi:hypothetical protein
MMTLDEVPRPPPNVDWSMVADDYVLDSGDYRWRLNMDGRLVRFIEYHPEPVPNGWFRWKRLYSGQT